jgi:hypothetical protein
MVRVLSLVAAVLVTGATLCLAGAACLAAEPVVISVENSLARRADFRKRSGVEL